MSKTIVLATYVWHISLYTAVLRSWVCLSNSQYCIYTCTRLTQWKCYKFCFNSSQYLAAHIHGPASPTETADAKHTISGFTKLGGSDEARGEWMNLTPDQIQDLKDGLYYINIHSNKFQDGEIRGQILITESVRCLLLYSSGVCMHAGLVLDVHVLFIS